MNYRSYYTEIKNRVLLLGILGVTLIFVSYFFKEVLIYLITFNFSSSRFSFIFTDVVEVFSIYLHLIFFFTYQVLIVYFFYHILLFFLPSLTKSEASFLVFTFAISGFLFFLSILVFNKILFPLSWKFFLSFQSFEFLKSISLDFEAKLLEYCLFYIKFYRICVLYFQIFVILVFLFQYIKIELYRYSRFRKLLYYFCVCFSTVVTPPDVLSQVIISFSLIVGCEILMYCFVFEKVLTSKCSYY